MITRDQALGLFYRQELYHVTNTNADGSPQRWRVNGKVKTWKRSPERFEVPIKHGLCSYDYLDEDTAHLLCLTEDEALATE